MEFEIKETRKIPVYYAGAAIEDNKDDYQIDEMASVAMGLKHIAITTDGNTLVAGLYPLSNSEMNSDCVTVYKNSGSSWQRSFTIKKKEEPSSLIKKGLWPTRFAENVAIAGSGRTIGLSEVGDGPQDGVVHIFEDNGFGWGKTATIVSPKEGFDNFGLKISFNFLGTRVVIGSFDKKGKEGAFHIFKRDVEGGWTLVESFFRNYESVEKFGRHVVMSEHGNTILCGDTHLAGAVTVLYRHCDKTEKWKETAKLAPKEAKYINTKGTPSVGHSAVNSEGSIVAVLYVAGDNDSEHVNVEIFEIDDEGVPKESCTVGLEFEVSRDRLMEYTTYLSPSGNVVTVRADAIYPSGRVFTKILVYKRTLDLQDKYSWEFAGETSSKGFYGMSNFYYLSCVRRYEGGDIAGALKEAKLVLVSMSEQTNGFNRYINKVDSFLFDYVPLYYRVVENLSSKEAAEIALSHKLYVDDPGFQLKDQLTYAKKSDSVKVILVTDKNSFPIAVGLLEEWSKLVSIYVKEEWRRKGVGSLIIKELKEKNPDLLWHDGLPGSDLFYRRHRMKRMFPELDRQGRVPITLWELNPS